MPGELQNGKGSSSSSSGPAPCHVPFQHAQLLDNVRISAQHHGHRAADEAAALGLEPDQAIAARPRQLHGNLQCKVSAIMKCTLPLLEHCKL